MTKPIWVIFWDIDKEGVCDVFFRAYPKRRYARETVRMLKTEDKENIWHYKIVKYVPDSECDRS